MVWYHDYGVKKSDEIAHVRTFVKYWRCINPIFKTSYLISHERYFCRHFSYPFKKLSSAHPTTRSFSDKSQFNLFPAFIFWYRLLWTLTYMLIHLQKRLKLNGHLLLFIILKEIFLNKNVIYCKKISCISKNERFSWLSIANR